jgi:hypothetical protein
VIGAGKDSARYPVLAGARAVFSQRDITLWRVDRTLPAVASVLRCEGMPRDGPADK